MKEDITHIKLMQEIYEQESLNPFSGLDGTLQIFMAKTGMTKEESMKVFFQCSLIQKQK